MKQHTADFKNELTNMGKRLDSIVTYGQTTLHDELYSASLHYEGSILKSVMKQLDLECSVELPLNAVINYQLGVKVGNNYEYLNYGNYVVYKVEKQEDKKTYKITCYDKMLYSMKDYEDMNIVYPISIKDYISAICLKLGISFKSYLDNFANNSKEIQNELYLDTNGNSLGYTFRDVLDELAQVTGSIICIDEATDMLEIRYPNQTNDTIDEQFLKNINVNFGEKYGAVNLLTLSRSADSDIIYYPDVIPENPCEIKIVDNQIMNFNDRDTYMPDIYNKIQGLEYYINDFNSIGILYYDLYDIYNVKIGEQTYKCIMLNNEINVTSGLEEIIHTEMPEEAETDYTKADKTDRRINQTYLIVNKQEQEITSLVNQIGDRSEKTTTITQDIDGIQSIVEDYEDLTRDAKGIHSVTINDAYPNEDILELHIYGNNSVFNYLYPQDDLYPDNTLYPYGDSRIRFYNDEEDRTIELGIEEVLKANTQVKDELFIDYQGNVSVIRRVNSDGTTKATPVTTVLGQLHFKLIEGNNTFEIVNYNAPIEVKYAIKSTYTDIFATKVEMNSSITQTAEEINLEVSKKVDEQEFGTLIQQNAYNVKIAWNNNTTCVQFEGNGLTLYDGAVSDYNKRATFDFDGNRFYRDGYYVGSISTARWSGNFSHKGLVFNLNSFGKYMAWAKRDSETEDYYAQICYSRDNSIFDEEGIHIGNTLNGHRNVLKNFEIGNLTAGGYTAFSGRIPFVVSIRDNKNGTITWNSSNLNITNGIITGYTT